MSNTKIIDYHNNNAGFILAIIWDYTGAAVVGEVVFDNISFGQETAGSDKIRINSFIHYTGPMNFTIQNSNLDVYYNEFENLDTYRVEDNGRCAPSDGVEQSVRNLNECNI